MTLWTRLNDVIESAIEIRFDDKYIVDENNEPINEDERKSKFILFSDCHRGDNSWADDFAHNQHIYFHALNYYYNKGFTYIEIGDGDELWENRKFADIRQAHSDIFWLLQQFFKKDRFYLIYGNHDMERKSIRKVRRTLHSYIDTRPMGARKGEVKDVDNRLSVEQDNSKSHQEKKLYTKELFSGINVHEGIVLRKVKAEKFILLIHGHQADIINDKLWWLGRFLLRHVWKHLQLLGFRDPTSPAKNYRKKVRIEHKLTEWVNNKTDVILIAGHTHRSYYPKKNESPYFNVGSCVSPRCITGIEIENGCLQPVKWSISTDSDDLKGVLYVHRSIDVEMKKKIIDI